MEKRKASLLCALLVVVLAAAAVGYYNSKYPIMADNSNLIEHASALLERRTTPSYQANIKLYDSLMIGNRKIVSAKVNGCLGEIELIRGLNGKYQIDSIGHGTNNFRGKVFSEGDRQYIFFIGQNPDLAIDSIRFAHYGFEYILDIPAEEIFITCIEVDPLVTYWAGEDITFYDAEGNDITTFIRSIW